MTLPKRKIGDKKKTSKIGSENVSADGDSKNDDMDDANSTAS